MFYDLALLERSTGRIVATWAGVDQWGLKHALLKLMFRAEGKMPLAANMSIRKHLDGADVVPDKNYGYVVRAASEVKEF